MGDVPVGPDTQVTTMAEQNYDEDAALEAALKASLMTVQEDDKRRKQKYGHLYTTMIPPVQAANVHGPATSSRSLGGSPITVAGCSPADPGLSSSQPSLKNSAQARTNVPQGGIARPRPQSIKGKNSDRFDSAFGNSSSTQLYPSVSAAASKTSPTVPPRPDVVQTKLPPPPLPTVGPNARGTQMQNNAAVSGTNMIQAAHNMTNSSMTPQPPHANCGGLGVLDQPLIKLSPPISKSNDPFGFDVNTLDPLYSSAVTAEGQMPATGTVLGFEGWLALNPASTVETQSNPMYWMNSNPFQNSSGFFCGANGMQQITGQPPQGGTLQRDRTSAAPNSQISGAGNYNTIQTTRGMTNNRNAFVSNVVPVQGTCPQRGPSPSVEVQKVLNQSFVTGPTSAQQQRVPSSASQQLQHDQAERHLSELSDLMDFSLDESDDFMTLGSFDPLDSMDQPTPSSDADLSFFAEQGTERAKPVPVTVPKPAPTAQASGFTLPLQTQALDKYAAFRQPSPMTIKSPEEEHYEKLTIMKINEMAKKSPSPVETPTSESAVDEGALQDPFSIDALTRELEEKRAKHAEEQVLRQALLRKRNAQEREQQEKMEQLLAEEEQNKKLFRRNSHMVKGQVSCLQLFVIICTHILEMFDVLQICCLIC